MKQAVGISRDTELPLLHRLALHGEAATHREAVGHLIVGEHRTQAWAPVHHGLGLISQAVVHQYLLLLFLAHCLPLGGSEAQRLAFGHIEAFGTFFLETGNQFADRLCLLATVAVERVKQLKECPLCPLVVAWLASAHLTVPVVAETDLVHLLAVAVDVLLGCHGGVSARLDGILLGGQTVSVVTHRMQHIKAFQPFISCINIRGNVAQRMSHVQASSRRIRKHIQDIEFRLTVVNINLIDFVVAPVLLPLLLDFGKVIVHTTRCFLRFLKKLQK